MAYQNVKPSAAGIEEELTGASAQSIHEQSATQKYPLGQPLVLQGGRKFRYCKASEALTAGYVCTALSGENHEDTLTAAVSAGATQLTVTNGTGADITADYYKDGQIVVYDATSKALVYSGVIAGNTAAANGATMTVYVYDPFENAADTGDDVTMTAQKWYVQVANDQFETPVCVPQIAVSSGYYFWGQVSGLGAAILEDAIGADGADERLLGMADSTPGKLQKCAAGQVPIAKTYTDAGDTNQNEAYIVDFCIE